MTLVIAVSVAVGVIAAAIAAAIFVLGSVRHHEGQHRRIDEGRRVRAGLRRRADCPMCAVSFEGAGDAAVIAQKNDHVLRRHARSPLGPQVTAVTPVTRVTRSA